MVGAGAGEQEGVGVGVGAGGNQAHGERKPAAQEYDRVARLVGSQELAIGREVLPKIFREEHPLSRKGRCDLAHSPRHRGQILEARCASVTLQQPHSAG